MSTHIHSHTHTHALGLQTNTTSHFLFKAMDQQKAVESFPKIQSAVAWEYIRSSAAFLPLVCSETKQEKDAESYWSQEIWSSKQQLERLCLSAMKTAKMMCSLAIEKSLKQEAIQLFLDNVRAGAPKVLGKEDKGTLVSDFTGRVVERVYANFGRLTRKGIRDNLGRSGDPQKDFLSQWGTGVQLLVRPTLRTEIKQNGSLDGVAICAATVAQNHNHHHHQRHRRRGGNQTELDDGRYISQYSVMRTETNVLLHDFVADKLCLWTYEYRLLLSGIFEVDGKTMKQSEKAERLKLAIVEHFLPEERFVAEYLTPALGGGHFPRPLVNLVLQYGGMRTTWLHMYDSAGQLNTLLSQLNVQTLTNHQLRLGLCMACDKQFATEGKHWTAADLDRPFTWTIAELLLDHLDQAAIPIDIINIRAHRHEVSTLVALLPGDGPVAERVAQNMPRMVIRDSPDTGEPDITCLYSEELCVKQPHRLTCALDAAYRCYRTVLGEEGKANAWIACAVPKGWQLPSSHQNGVMDISGRFHFQPPGTTPLHYPTAQIYFGPTVPTDLLTASAWDSERVTSILLPEPSFTIPRRTAAGMPSSDAFAIPRQPGDRHAEEIRPLSTGNYLDELMRKLIFAECFKK